VKKLVLASSNPGKLRELEALLGPLGFEVIPQTRLGVEDAKEPHASFVGNALAKARHASRQTRLPALADDSGLCALALGGEPGVHSARFAGEPPPGSMPGRKVRDARNNEKLIALLAGKEDRRAHYTCVIAFMRHADDPEPVIAEGRWEGEIIAVPRGGNGFGYDPHFFLPDLGRTAAELDPEQKNLLSHRGKALRLLLAKLKEGA
jgi:XTP/dITP diphosphohydrolase